MDINVIGVIEFLCTPIQSVGIVTYNKARHSHTGYVKEIINKETLTFAQWIMRKRYIPRHPLLSEEKHLKTLVENRTTYNLKHCELNLFETYQSSQKVSLSFPDLVVTSMLKGKKIMHLADRSGFDYLPGESLILPANVEMKIDFPEAETKNPTQCLALTIDYQKISQTLIHLSEVNANIEHSWALPKKGLLIENNADLTSTIDKLMTICQSGVAFKDILADLALQELVVKILQSQTLADLSLGKTIPYHPVLYAAITLIQENLKTKVDLKKISKQVGLSTSTFYRLFKNELGISPVQFILLERIKLAKKCLGLQGIHIKEVSYQAGFEDCNYFIRTFKQHEGITPKQYQQILQK